MSRVQRTEGESDTLALYMDDVRQHDVPSKEGMASLADMRDLGRIAALMTFLSDGHSRRDQKSLEQVIEAGQDAVGTMVVSNLRLVVSLAKRQIYSPLPLEDRVQEGNLGLMRAVEKFDQRKGFRFSSYATPMVRQAIRRGEQKVSTVKIPHNRLNQIRILKKLEDEHRASGTPLSLEVLCDTLRVGPDELEEIYQARRTLKGESLHKPVGDDGDAELHDFIPDAETSDVEEEVSAKAEAIDMFEEQDFSPNEKGVIALRFGLGLTQDEVARQLNLSNTGVRNIEKRARNKLIAAAERGPRRRKH